MIRTYWLHGILTSSRRISRHDHATAAAKHTNASHDPAGRTKRDWAAPWLVGEAVDEEPVGAGVSGVCFVVEKPEGVLVVLVVAVPVEVPATPLDTELIGVHDDVAAAGCGGGVAPSP